MSPTRRMLRSVAHNLLDSLLSGPYSLQDGDILVQMDRSGQSAGVPAVTLDLLTGRVNPEEARTPELEKLAATATARLQELLAGVGLPPTSVMAGVLSAGPQAVTVTLEDDLGHQHSFVPLTPGGGRSQLPPQDLGRCRPGARGRRLR